MVEKSLPDDIGGGNKVNSESGEGPEVSYDKESIVAYLNDPDGNNFADNGDEWVLNENINFDYFSCCDDVNSPIDVSPLHCIFL